MEMIIGKPYIEHLGNGKSRLCSCITTCNEKRVLYYEVEEEYEKYLNADRLDCFVVGLINNCMNKNFNIVCEAPISEQLLFQLDTFYVPVIADLFSCMNCIRLNSPVILSEVSNEGAVGTGNSGGVDSTYTMLKYSSDVETGYKLTHVLFTNISSNDSDEDRIRKLFDRDCIIKKNAAEFLNLKQISCFTNLYSFYDIYIFNKFFAQQYCSAPLALGKLFKVYYFSSTFKISDFCMDEKKIVSAGRYDAYSLITISTNSLVFYSAGTEVDRMDKIDYISESDYTYKYLQVCAIEQSAGGKHTAKKLNCGHCNKCGRMIGIYYAQGIIEQYKHIFDLSYFTKNKAKFIGKNLEADQGAFAIKVEKLLKQKQKYPFGTDFYRLLYRLRYWIAKNKRLVKIYHKIKGIED